MCEDSASSLFVSGEAGKEVLIPLDKSLKQVVLCLYEDRKLPFEGLMGSGQQGGLLGFLDSLI